MYKGFLMFFEYFFDSFIGGFEFFINLFVKVFDFEIFVEIIGLVRF